MIPEWLSLIDVAFLVVAFLFGLSGFQKGFAGQVAHVITFLVLGVALFFGYRSIMGYFRRLLQDLPETYITWLAIAGLVVLAIVFFILVSKLLANVLKTQISNQSDCGYGFILGFVRGALVALFVMVFLVILGPAEFQETLCFKSQAGRLVCNELVPCIRPHVTPAAREEYIDALHEALIHQEEDAAASMVEEIGYPPTP